MNSIAQEDFKQIVHSRHAHAVSFYIPTHRSGAETRQARIHLKNQLAQAEAELRERGLGADETRRFLLPVAELEDNSRFWSFQSDGLALFLADGLFKSFQLPKHFNASVHVAERFYLRPVLPFIGAQNNYLVLALSKNAARLLECSQFGSSRVELEDLPQGIEGAIGELEREKQLQFHTSAPSSGQGGRAAVFHGHGGGDNDEDVRLEQYLRAVDKAVQQHVAGQDLPLVLACVKEHAAMFRGISTSRHIVEEVITGNPDRRLDEDLRAESWSFVQALFKQEQHSAIDRFNQVHGTGLGSQDLREIISSARGGKVERLLFSSAAQHWGTIPAENESVELHTERSDDSLDLVEEAALYTIETGGSVYVVGDGELETETGLAALYRY